VAIGPVEVTTLDGQRAQGTFGSPNVLGGYLAIALLPALALLLSRTRLYYRWLGAISFGFGCLALVLTQSRGAWIGFTAAAAVLLLYAWHEGWLSGAAPFAIGLVVLGLALLLQDEIVQRIVGDDNRAAVSRIPLMDLAFQMIRDNPLLGVGANNFSLSLPQYLTVANSRDFVFTVHNKYLLVWSETGIGGLIAFVWFLGATIRRGWRLVTARNRVVSPLAFGLIAGLVANMIHMNVEIFNGRSQVMMLWLVAALLLAPDLKHATEARSRANLAGGLPSGSNASD
jgi:O-antigen ligase